MQIDIGKLTVGKKVWYKFEYSEYRASGPFKVIKLFSNHEGPQVTLDGPLPMRGVRNVSLADDEDYGLPIFYDSDPAVKE